MFLSQAIKLRECSKCPRLPKSDPRLNLEAVKKILLQGHEMKHSPAAEGVVITRKITGMKSAAAMATNSTVVSKDLPAEEKSNIPHADSAKSAMLSNKQLAQSDNQSLNANNLSCASNNLSDNSSNSSAQSS